MKISKKTNIASLLIATSILFTACGIEAPNGDTISSQQSNESMPKFADSAYIQMNGNQPTFTDAEIKEASKSYETYSDLDFLGRCGQAIVSIGKDIMPTEERENIGQVKPSGWQTVKYDNVDGKYLYNRCHLIGFQLSGENTNEKNLITGTRYLNVEGMLPFENMIADYVVETDNHVLYRVTPIFENKNLLAGGVQMEAYSVEDSGKGISFNVYTYNNQPGITIDYLTGKSNLSQVSDNASSEAEIMKKEYILNTNSKKIHLPSCSSVKDMKETNKKSYSGNSDELIAQGYEACKSCQ